MSQATTGQVEMILTLTGQLQVEDSMGNKGVLKGGDQIDLVKPHKGMWHIRIRNPANPQQWYDLLAKGSLCKKAVLVTELGQDVLPEPSEQPEPSCSSSPSSLRLVPPAQPAK